jgi:hypothetical protein
MSEAEAEVYRYLEVTTMDPPPYCLDAGPLFDLCAERGWLERLGFGWRLSVAGWEWLTARFERIRAACNAGRHEWAKKHPSHLEHHCRWCGACEADRCPDCHPTYQGAY